MSGTHTWSVKATGDVCISLCVCHKEGYGTAMAERRRAPGSGVCLTRALWLHTESDRNEAGVDSTTHLLVQLF